jgi:hypothetical protein
MTLTDPCSMCPHNKSDLAAHAICFACEAPIKVKSLSAENAKLKEEREIHLRLLTLLRESNGKSLGAPLYSLNPTFRTMQCVEAAVNGGDAQEIKDCLMRNDLWQ